MSVSQPVPSFYCTDQFTKNRTHFYFETKNLLNIVDYPGKESNLWNNNVMQFFPPQTEKMALTDCLIASSLDILFHAVIYTVLSLTDW